MLERYCRNVSEALKVSHNERTSAPDLLRLSLAQSFTAGCKTIQDFGSPINGALIPFVVRNPGVNAWARENPDSLCSNAPSHDNVALQSAACKLHPISQSNLLIDGERWCYSRSLNYSACRFGSAARRWFRRSPKNGI